MRKHNLCVLLFIMVILLLAQASIPSSGEISNSYSMGKHWFSYKSIIYALTKYLVVEKPIHVYDSTKGSDPTTVIYVLGGNQDSLTSRFRKAANLYHQGLSKKILILSRPGITEFNPDLRRNMTNDEWAIRELGTFHVTKEDVEPVSVKKGIFGTLSEARVLTELVQRKGYKKLILVSSGYHTRRVFNTFSNIASGTPLELYICGSNDIPGIPGIAMEYLKLFIYDTIVLPVNHWKSAGNKRNYPFSSLDPAKAN